MPQKGYELARLSVIEGKACVSTALFVSLIVIAVAVDGANLIHAHKVQQSQQSTMHVTHTQTTQQFSSQGTGTV